MRGHGDRDAAYGSARGQRIAGGPRACRGQGRERHGQPGLIEGLIAKRAAAATEHALDGPNQKLLRAQKPVWVALCDHYFRLETSGWERLPQQTSLLIGNHPGGPDDGCLDARLRLVRDRRRARASSDRSRCPDGRARPRRLLPPVWRDPGLPPRRQRSAQRRARRDHLAGGEVDSMRNWRRRDEAVLGERKGFVRQAIRSGVPIVPVASVGGHDTVFVLPRAAGSRTGSTASPG